MSRTNIEWCMQPGTLPEAWNIVTGCNKVSRGCKHCYAEIMHRRLMHMYPKKYNKPFLDGAVMHPDLLELPLSWTKPRTVFVNSMSDLFHENVSFEFIQQALQVMYKCRELHTFIILTKRADRALEFEKWMVENINAFWFGFDKNVWIVASVENQEAANDRIPKLLQVTAQVRGLSCEPLVGPVKLKQIQVPGTTYFFNCLKSARINFGGNTKDITGRINWVIGGGESGHKAAPMHPDWPRKLRDDCAAAGVPFFFKQWGEWANYKLWPADHHMKIRGHFSNVNRSSFIKGETMVNTMNMYKVGKHNSGRLLDGVEYNEFPKVKELFA